LGENHVNKGEREMSIKEERYKERLLKKVEDALNEGMVGDKICKCVKCGSEYTMPDIARALGFPNAETIGTCGNCEP
jgi:hypothetical protein